MVARTYSDLLQDGINEKMCFSLSQALQFGLLIICNRLLRVSRVLGLRKRYIFTKQDRLRLRYVVCAGLICVALGFAMVAPVVRASVDPSAPSTAGGEIMSDAGAVQDSDLLNARLIGDASDDASTMAGSMMKAVAMMKKPEKPPVRSVKISAGGTLAGALQDAGVGVQDAYYAVKALSEYFDPRKVKAGQAIDVHMKRDEAGQAVFNKMVLMLDAVKSVSVERASEGFTAELKEKELVTQTFARAATIQTSLYGSAARAGIPPQIIAELIRAYSWDVDFQRDIRQGDKIEVLYTAQKTEDGDFAGYGDIAYASLSVGGHEKPIYRYEMKDGRVDYFGPDGRSVRKTLMRTPIDGARLSSGFGMRKHPILGYDKMHKGTDFAAPTGTPIYAAGDGVIEYAGRKGAYGNYIRLRHNSTLKTAYAHLHKFAPKMGVGKRVEQGQIIGYVGTTGRSTGPHLHYEVLVSDAQVNPNRVDLPVGETLEGTELARFKALVGATSQEYATLIGDLKFADNVKHDEEAFTN